MSEKETKPKPEPTVWVKPEGNSASASYNGNGSFRCTQEEPAEIPLSLWEQIKHQAGFVKTDPPKSDLPKNMRPGAKPAAAAPKEAK